MKSPSGQPFRIAGAENHGQLRVSAGRYPDDAELAALITELSARSAGFRRIWAGGEVVMCGAGRKRLRHPVAGLLTLDYETLHVPSAPGETGLRHRRGLRVGNPVPAFQRVRSSRTALAMSAGASSAM